MSMAERIVEEKNPLSTVDNLNKIIGGCAHLLTRPDLGLDKKTRKWAEKVMSKAELKIKLLKIDYPDAFKKSTIDGCR